MSPDREGDILVFDYPSAGRTLVLDGTCVGSYTSARGLNHTPDGLPVCAARIAEGKKEVLYAALDKQNLPRFPPPGVRRVLRDGAAGGRVSPTFGEHRRDTEDRVFRGTQLLPQLRHPSSQVVDPALADHQ